MPDIVFNIGDIVKVSEFYSTHYPEWKHKDELGEVMSVKSSKVYHKNLGKEDRALFQSLYGLQAEYEIIELMVDICGTKYMGSQFGFNKI
jgi:hypothetical protein